MYLNCLAEFLSRIFLGTCTQPPGGIKWNKTITTVDGWNPAPVDREFIPLFTRFSTSQVVQDFFHQQYNNTTIHPTVLFLPSSIIEAEQDTFTFR